MTRTRRTRNDPRRELTRKALLNAAETLFAEQGIRAVTVRQIAAAAHSSNNNVISYHFGGKEALIDAVYQGRLLEFDARSGEFLSAISDDIDRRIRLRHLAEALWRPTFAAVNGDGRRTYARFLRSVLTEDQGYRLGRITNVYPNTRQILDEMARLVPGDPGQHFQWRLATVTYMVLDAICLIEEQTLARPEEADLLFDKVLDMAVAVLLA